MNSSGQASGTSKFLRPARFDPPWLTEGPCGALEFFAPIQGATTPHSPHARTELQSAGHFTLGTGTASLHETIAVTQVPAAKPEIIIAQFLAPDGGPYAHIQYDAGTVSVSVHDVGTFSLLTGVPLGATFSDSLTASGATLTITATRDGQTITKTATNPAAFTGKQMIMKAGDYQQGTASESSSDGGRVTISALSTSGLS